MKPHEETWTVRESNSHGPLTYVITPDKREYLFGAIDYSTGSDPSIDAESTPDDTGLEAG